MPNRNLFEELTKDQIQTLLKRPLNELRLLYIDLMALLQDILGRYSSGGNPSVFLDTGEAVIFVYENLRKIEGFHFSDVRFGMRNTNVGALRKLKKRGHKVKFSHRRSTFIHLFVKPGEVEQSNDFKNIKTKAEIELNNFETLHRGLYRIASNNVSNALSLKNMCEKFKPLEAEKVEKVDAFLDSLLTEYQLLRNPPNSSTPGSKPNQIKSSNSINTSK